MKNNDIIDKKNEIDHKDEIDNKNIIRLKPNIVSKNNNNYVKITQNQFRILDALLYDGSYKRYIDTKKNLRYSEHSGLFEFRNNNLDRIVISGKSTYEDLQDKSILLPNNIYKNIENELIFHTHPPTPYPGARSIGGILYEFPSVSDLNHFIFYYNKYYISGSMIIAPEGVYIIYMKKYIDYVNYIDKPTYKKLEAFHYKINDKAIKKYGIDFTNHRKEIFFNEVIDDKRYIKLYNNSIKKYIHPQIHVLYKPRVYDRSINSWIIKTLYFKLNNFEQIII